MSKQYQRLICERKGADGEALWITLNHEKMRNALDDAMQRELMEVFNEIALDHSIRCVVVSGAGDKAFCSGGDIAAFQAMDNATIYDYIRLRGNALQELLAAMEKPVIAAVHGYCLAGGLELALMCDFIYSTEDARFGLMEINIGLLAGWGGTTGLPRAISVRRAKEMIYRGEMIRGVEACQLGLVNKVFPSREEMMESVEKVVAEITSKPPLALRAAKTTINASLKCDSTDSVLAVERGNIMWLFNSEDKKEGVAAFVEKRKPHFTGR